MKVTFRSKQAGLSVAHETLFHVGVQHDMFNNAGEWIGSPEEWDKRQKLPDPDMVGKTYEFFEGEDHNELTLTEPIEILNMRDWLKGRKDFIEVLCDKEAESLTDVDIATVNEADLPIEPFIDRAEDELSDWDFQISKILSTR